MAAAEQTQTPNKSPSFLRYALFIGVTIIACELLSTEAAAEVPQGVPLTLHIPDIPPIDKIPLTVEGLKAELASLEHAQAAVQSFHDKYVYVAPANDPDLLKLKHIIDFYHAEHGKLLALKGQIIQQEFAEQQPFSAYHKSIRAGRIYDELAKIAETKKFVAAEASLKEIDTFVGHATPGSVIYTDTEGKFGPKGARFWYPLEGGSNPQNPNGPKLPRLLSFKYAGASQLPLSTSRAVYDLQLTLTDRMTLTTPLGEVLDPKSKPFVTAGAFDDYRHARFGGHSDLSAIDFRAIDKTPAGVAEVLADAAHAPNGYLWYELPGSEDNPADVARLTTFRASAVNELMKHGMSENQAQTFIVEHTRLVSGANVEHYHFDTEPRPPILAPDSFTATKFAAK